MPLHQRTNRLWMATHYEPLLSHEHCGVWSHGGGVPCLPLVGGVLAQAGQCEMEGGLVV